MVVGFLEFIFVFLNVIQIVRGIRELLQMTTERGLRLFLLGPDNRVESALTLANVSVASEEIHRAGAEAEQLRHPCIVVVFLRDVTISAILRRTLATGCVREMW